MLGYEDNTIGKFVYDSGTFRAWQCVHGVDHLTSALLESLGELGKSSLPERLANTYSLRWDRIPALKGNK